MEEEERHACLVVCRWHQEGVDRLGTLVVELGLEGMPIEEVEGRRVLEQEHTEGRLALGLVLEHIEGKLGVGLEDNTEVQVQVQALALEDNTEVLVQVQELEHSLLEGRLEQEQEGSTEEPVQVLVQKHTLDKLVLGLVQNFPFLELAWVLSSFLRQKMLLDIPCQIPSPYNE